MKPLFLHVFAALWTDESAAKRWLFGLLGFFVTLASMMFVDGVAIAFTWTGRQWAEKALTALIALVFSMVNPGGKLPAKAPAPGVQS